jgi:UDP-N-acetylglucosamine acyltransferase
MKPIIHPTAIIGPNVTIEDDVFIGPYCVIGTHAEYRRKVNERTDEPGRVLIGRGTTIREFVTVHGSATLGGETIIMNDCYIQAHAHIGHDAYISARVTIGCHAIVAGHVMMWMYSGLGLAAVTHQHATVGRGAFIGASAFFKGDAEPFKIYAGVPAKPIGPNVRLARALRDQGLGILVPRWLDELLDQSPTGSDPSSHPQHTPPEPPDVPPCDPSL